MLQLDNAHITAVNLTTGPELAATVTIRIVNPSDSPLAALLAMSNQEVTGTLAATDAG